jgi:hypothetical protein
VNLQDFIATVNQQAPAKQMPPLESGDTLGLVDGGEVVTEIVVP